MIDNQTSVSFIINVRLIEPHKVNRLIALIETVYRLPNTRLSLRIRGKYDSTISSFIHGLDDEKLKRTSLYVGSHTFDWRFDTLIQVTNESSDIYCLINEDHVLMSDDNYFLNFVSDFAHTECDVSAISFFQLYSPLRTWLGSNFPYDRTNSLVTKYIEKETWKSMDSEVVNYMVTLVGMYRKKTLTKILKSKNPTLRRYPPSFPFDFEQDEKQTWFLPIKFSLPNLEMFCCIDSDNGVQGSSLISRGLYIEETPRRVIHNRYDAFHDIFFGLMSENAITRYLEKIFSISRSYNYLMYSILATVRYPFVRALYEVRKNHIKLL
jgi:hypothetical protein